MHIPENYLSPATCAVMTAAMLPVWTHAVKRVKLDLPKEKIPMVGVGAAFSFLAMMFNVPLVGGTTGHAVGGALIALLFGPDAACLAVSVALLLQAVIFGDGGILAFGANCFNMAFVLPYVGYAASCFLMKITESTGSADKTKNKNSTARSCICAAVGAYIGLNTAAFLAAVEFGIQPLLFKDAAGNALYCPYPLSISIPAMLIPHLAVAGFVEAGFTAAVLAYIRKTAPGFIFEPAASREMKDGAKTPAPIFALLAVLIAATPLGLLAAGTAWGEWGAEEIAETTAGGQALGYIPKGLAEGWSLDVVMPDYAMEGMGEIPAYILSAVIGVALLIIIFKLFSLVGSGKYTENSRQRG